MKQLNFPGGALDKNPSANAGDTGSIPGPGLQLVVTTLVAIHLIIRVGLCTATKSEGSQKNK